MSEAAADPPSTTPHTPDPDDDYLVALALAADADALVSGDQHLTALTGSGILIETPRDFLNRISSAR